MSESNTNATPAQASSANGLGYGPIKPLAVKLNESTRTQLDIIAQLRDRNVTDSYDFPAAIITSNGSHMRDDIRGRVGCDRLKQGRRVPTSTGAPGQGTGGCSTYEWRQGSAS